MGKSGVVEGRCSTAVAIMKVRIADDWYQKR